MNSDDKKPTAECLKRDLFGEVWLCTATDSQYIERRHGRAPLATRWIARWLAHREARALTYCATVDGTPSLLHFDSQVLRRSYLAGTPMQRAVALDKDYFRAALRLLRRLHRAGVAHNDLAKEPNWLVTADGEPAVIDFQLAMTTRRRSRWFRTLAREDLRHLLKHKRTYSAATLTARQQRLLATKAWPSRVWMATVKPVYLFVTRRVLGWADREGAGDRFGR
ncbi:MAG: serine/threonine protein kinase [Pseudomonadota bacterium]